MKKVFICLITLLLMLATLCGCSLLSGAETTVESTATQLAETPVTEPPALDNWGAAFAADGTQQQIAYAFLSTVFPETWNAQFSCDVKTTITKWGIDEASQDDVIKGSVSFAVFAAEPSEADNAILNEGPVQPGKDEYEGSVILTRYFSLQKQPDGNWQCVGFGLS